jgi:hypothetical protein
MKSTLAWAAAGELSKPQSGTKQSPAAEAVAWVSSHAYLPKQQTHDRCAAVDQMHNIPVAAYASRCAVPSDRARPAIDCSFCSFLSLSCLSALHARRVVVFVTA